MDKLKCHQAYSPLKSYFGVKELENSLKSIPVLIFSIFCNTTYCYSQIYGNINVGVGSSNYKLDEAWNQIHYTSDSIFNRLHVMYGVGVNYKFSKKLKFGISLNFSSRKLDFRNYDKHLINFENCKYYSTDINNFFSYKILKHFNLGLIYQFTVIQNLKYKFNDANILKIKDKYYNSLIGYLLGFEFSNINFAIQYLPHSMIYDFDTRNKWYFPFTNSQNIQVNLSYDHKLFDLKLKRKTKNLECPVF